ncbi:MAG: DUF6870 family protein [Roseburia sp.]
MENRINFEELKTIDPRQVEKDDLVDIQDVRINEQLQKEERISDFIRQIKNPYVCRCGDMVVQSVFADSDATLTDRLAQYFRLT